MSFHAKKIQNNLLGNLITGFGIGLLLLSAIIFVRLFMDPIKQEIQYQKTHFVSDEGDDNVTCPPGDFNIYIPSLPACAKIIIGVDPFDSRIYQNALRDGIAHARGTKLPGEGGNIFLFAHSSADIFTAKRYNSIFYLMHHLESGDAIKVYKDGKEYDYAVTQKLFVAQADTQYLTGKSSTEQLTLMTCWPPGTTLKRLIIIARPQ